MRPPPKNRCAGDTTLCDSLTPSSPRFELCHGYPPASAAAPAAPAICACASGVGGQAPAQLLRGTTRSSDTWHVYTAIFDGAKSEMFVDGVREASGRSVGNASLDGLLLGCDHTSTFFLRGKVAEVRVFSCHLGAAPREQMEAAIAMRYGLATATPPPATPPAPSLASGRVLGHPRLAAIGSRLRRVAACVAA